MFWICPVLTLPNFNCKIKALNNNLLKKKYSNLSHCLVKLYMLYIHEILMVNQIKTLCLTCVKTHGLIILITAVSSGTSCVLSFTMALTSFAAMQMFKQQLAGSEYMTIVGGLLGSTIFFFVLVVSFCLWCCHYSLIHYIVLSQLPLYGHNRYIYLKWRSDCKDCKSISSFLTHIKQENVFAEKSRKHIGKLEVYSMCDKHLHVD